MKIIFSPSKEMNFKGETNLCNSSDIDLLNKFNEIYLRLVDLSKEEVERKFRQITLFIQIKNTLHHLPLFCRSFTRLTELEDCHIVFPLFLQRQSS